MSSESDELLVSASLDDLIPIVANSGRAFLLRRDVMRRFPLSRTWTSGFWSVLKSRPNQFVSVADMALLTGTSMRDTNRDAMLSASALRRVLEDAESAWTVDTRVPVGDLPSAHRALFIEPIPYPALETDVVRLRLRYEGGKWVGMSPQVFEALMVVLTAEHIAPWEEIERAVWGGAVEPMNHVHLKKGMQNALKRLGIPLSVKTFRNSGLYATAALSPAKRTQLLQGLSIDERNDVRYEGEIILHLAPLGRRFFEHLADVARLGRPSSIVEIAQSVWGIDIAPRSARSMLGSAFVRDWNRADCPYKVQRFRGYGARMVVAQDLSKCPTRVQSARIHTH